MDGFCWVSNLPSLKDKEGSSYVSNLPSYEFRVVLPFTIKGSTLQIVQAHS